MKEKVSVEGCGGLIFKHEVTGHRVKTGRSAQMSSPQMRSAKIARTAHVQRVSYDNPEKNPDLICKVCPYTAP